jgi:hypothetical protein
VFDNDEKVSIVRRVLLGLEATGVERVLIMPDSFGIGRKALDGLRLRLEASVLKMPRWFTPDDSTRAAALMAEPARCIVTLGATAPTGPWLGRGTVPLMPDLDGDQQRVPDDDRGTIAGLAAGLVACGQAGEAVSVAPRLDVVRPTGRGLAWSTSPSTPSGSSPRGPCGTPPRSGRSC